MRWESWKGRRNSSRLSSRWKIFVEREGERRERRKERKTLLSTEKFSSRERDRVEKLTRDGKFPSCEKEEEGRRRGKKEEGEKERERERSGRKTVEEREEEGEEDFLWWKQYLLREERERERKGSVGERDLRRGVLRRERKSPSLPYARTRARVITCIYNLNSYPN